MRPESPILLTVLTMMSIELTTAFPNYRSEIPNGSNVPDPCRPGRIWQGVGHLNRFGGGARNPFGIDFATAGYQWTPALCNGDSDGDGVTNGVELGDPNCSWTRGGTPTETTGLTHPGIDNSNPECTIPPWLWALLFWWTP